MEKKLNGFNNGRDTTDGIGGKASDMETNKDLFGNDIPPEPTVYFKASTIKRDDGWMMCDAGCSGIDNEDWVVTTHFLKSDEVPDECTDAKTFCELVANLLNEYYNK